MLLFLSPGSPTRNPHSLLFSGATLSLGGCGHFVETTAERDMYKNLVLQIGSLPGDTEIYSSHE